MSNAALAAETTPANPVPAAEEKTLEQFGRDTPICEEWSDGCAVCVRRSGSIACSLPGIACQPKAPACRDAPPR